MRDVHGEYHRRHQQSGPGRAVGVRLVFKGHADPSLRPTEAIKLDGVCEEMLASIPELDVLEYGSTPGEIQHEYFFVGYTDDRNHERATKKALGDGPGLDEWAEIEDNSKTPTGRSPDSIAQKMRDIIEEGTPSFVTATVCELDFSPLGLIPRPTSRLLVTENTDFTRIDVTSQSALFEIVTTLYERGIPHLFACLITPAGQSAAYEYLGTCRLVVFGTDNGIVTADDIETFTETVDKDYRLSSYFPNRDIIDNFGLPAELHRRTARDSSFVTPVEQMDDLSGRQTTVSDLKAGLTEYSPLLHSRMNADQRYRELFDCYGVFKMQKRDLLHFFVAVPLFYDHSLWGRSVTADGIQFITHDLGERIDGTRQSYGTEEPGDTTRELDNTNEESEDHQELVSDWVVFLIRNGHEILWIDQDDVDFDFNGRDPTQNPEFDHPSCPDIVSKKNGQRYYHEIEVHNKSKPAQLLTNLARAAYDECPVFIVTPTRPEARQKFVNENDADRMGPVLEPCRDADADGIIEHNGKGTVEPAEGVTVVLPEEVSESRWRLIPDDIRQLVVNGEVVAEGPADKSVDTYTYNLPRVREQGSGYVLESSTGEVIREQPTKKAARGDLTKVYKPFPSTAWDFQSNVTVMYNLGDEFQEYEFTPDWATRYRDSNSRRYEEAAEEFIEKVTVESEGDSIPMSELRALFLDWYQAQTDCTEPSATWFGRSVRQCSGGYEVDATNTRNKTLENRRFIFTEGIYSPDLPFIDGDTDDE